MPHNGDALLGICFLFGLFNYFNFDFTFHHGNRSFDLDLVSLYVLIAAAKR